MKKYTSIALYITLCGIFLFSDAFSQNKTNTITFCYTNSLNGTLEACRCGDPRGGLIKRGYAIAQLKKKYPDLLLLDSGDFCSYYPDTLLTKYVIKGYKHIGYTAVGIGDQEFAAGVDTFHTYSTYLPFVCANLKFYAKGKWQAVKPSITVTVGTTKIGITAVINNDAFKYYPDDITTKIKISDYTQALKNELKNLQNADLIVVLSHLGFEKDKELAILFPSIGLIVGGHSQTLVKKPVKVGNTLIVQAGPGGARIGVLNAIVQNGVITKYTHSFVQPKWEDPDDPVIEKMIAEYNEENAKRFPR
ncbi:MAG: hypothetical protein WHV26_08620 [Spirochaetota bacterium]